MLMSDEKISLARARICDWQKVLEFEMESKSRFFVALENGEQVKDYLSKSRVYLVKLGRESIGTVSFKPEGDSAYMDGLTICQKHRGKGFAKIAMRLIMEKVRCFRRVYIRVHPQSTPAVMIYLKEGFKPVGWEDNHYGDNEPRLVMEKINK